MFHDKQYPVNVQGAQTVFYPANSLSLGDNILWTIIFQDYLKNNPAESVSFVPFNTDISALVKSEKINKLFIRQPSCVSDNQVAELIKLTDVFRYELHVECYELWKRGIYPVFDPGVWSMEHGVAWITGLGAFMSAPLLSHYTENIKYEMSGKYVVFHIRNIKTIKSKNTDPELVRSIMRHLVEDYFDESYVVLLGNDDSYGSDVELLQCDRVVDLRKKLALDEIYRVIQSCRLYIGSDSGMVHLAGCCDVPMVCWNFVDEYWFPKVRNLDRCLFLTKEESRLEVVLREVKRKLNQT